MSKTSDNRVRQRSLEEGEADGVGMKETTWPFYFILAGIWVCFSPSKLYPDIKSHLPLRLWSSPEWRYITEYQLRKLPAWSNGYLFQWSYADTEQDRGKTELCGWAGKIIPTLGQFSKEWTELGKQHSWKTRKSRT